LANFWRRNCWFTNVPFFSKTESVGRTTFAAALVALAWVPR
jgi:hypothetical protein